jgi:DNA-binding SARP family transcriptional activator
MESLMGTLRVYLFGRLRLELGGRPLAGLSQKAQELLCYLLLHGDESHHRESLADLLWDYAAPGTARKYLRQALWQLRRVLVYPQGQAPLLLAEANWVQLNPAATLWTDVAAFEQAFARSQEVRGRELTGATLQTLQTAVELYRGELLKGWYQDWCQQRREQLRGVYQALLGKLIDYCTAHHLYEAGLRYAHQALDHDRADERTHRQLMWLHALSGNRTAALSQYEHCVAILEEDLDTAPGPCTTALYQCIQAGQVAGRYWLDEVDLAPAAVIWSESCPATPGQAYVFPPAGPASETNPPLKAGPDKPQ